MEKLRKMTVDGIEYNLLTDADIEEIKLVSRLETLASDIEVYKALRKKRYGEEL